MRKWGTIISVFYAVIVLFFLVPATVFLVGKTNYTQSYVERWISVYQAWAPWIPIVIVLAGQALLLFLSVDTSRQRLKPRAHILVSCLVTATLFALLTGAGLLSLGFGAYGDKFGDFLERRPFLKHDGGVNTLLCWAVLWLAWTIVFYMYFRNSNASITRATSWLLKGSVLELLIAVPSHVLARRRNDCSAPVVTSFGIATGIAIMLLSFGPGVLLLYKKRLDAYGKSKAASQ